MGASPSLHNDGHDLRVPKRPPPEITPEQAATLWRVLSEQGAVVLELQSDRPTIEAQRFYESTRDLLRVNFYTFLNTIAFGHDLQKYCSHDAISIAVKQFFQDLHAQSPFREGMSASDLIKEIETGYVAGFKDGNSTLIIRIESCFPRSSDPLDPEWVKILAKYRTVIDTAVQFGAAPERNLQVLLDPLSSTDVQIIKMLGETHRIRPIETVDEQWVRKARISIPHGQFYGSIHGTRYKTIEQFQNDLLGPCPPTSKEPKDLFPLVDHPARCISFLEGLTHFMSPSKRNFFGRREAQFLLTSPKSGHLLNEEKTASIHSELLPALVNDLRTWMITDAEGKNPRWSVGPEKIRERILDVCATLRSQCHTCLHHDTLSDPDYVKAVSTALIGNRDSELMQFELPSGFHTALKAIDIGRFVVQEDGTRKFQVREDLSDKYNKFIAEFCKAHPEALDAAWLVLLEPLRPLTEVDVAPEEAEDPSSDYTDDSVVILFGNPNQLESQYVIGTDPDSPDSIKARGVKPGEYGKLSLEDLSYLRHLEKSSKFGLFNRILNVASDSTAPLVPPFSLHNGLRIRPYLHGKVCSRLGRHTLDYAVIERVMDRLGPICATFFATQSQNFALHDLLLHNFEKSPFEASLLHMGVSQTFRPKELTWDYLFRSVSLFGAHTASWIAAFCHGDHGRHLSVADRGRIVTDLITIAGDSFRSSLLRIRERGISFRDVTDAYKRLSNEFRSRDLRIPAHLDLRSALLLTKEVVECDRDDLLGIAELFKQNTARFVRHFDELITQSALMGGSSGEVTEELNRAYYSLISNHLSTSRANLLNQVLDGGILEFSKYSQPELTWLFNLVNVAFWIVEISSNSRQERTRMNALLSKALDPQTTLKDFCQSVQSLKEKVHLTYSQAEMFYTSVRQLRDAWQAHKSSAPERAEALDFAARCLTGGLIRLRDINSEGKGESATE